MFWCDMAHGIKCFKCLLHFFMKLIFINKDE